MRHVIIFTSHMSWSSSKPGNHLYITHVLVCISGLLSSLLHILYIRHLIVFTPVISLSLHQLWHCFHIGYVIIFTTTMSLSSHQACHGFTSGMPWSLYQVHHHLYVRHFIFFTLDISLCYMGFCVL